MTAKRWIALAIAAALFVVSTFASVLWSVAKLDFKKEFTSAFNMNATYDTDIIKTGNPANKIAVLTVNGTIQDTGEGASLLNSGTYNHQFFMNQLDEILDNHQVKGVLLKVNSPGGGTNESKQIYEKIVQIKKNVKSLFTYPWDRWLHQAVIIFPHLLIKYLRMKKRLLVRSVLLCKDWIIVN
jgi:Periplasmic serine proteases (ClpP class)